MCNLGYLPQLDRNARVVAMLRDNPGLAIEVETYLAVLLVEAPGILVRDEAPGPILHHYVNRIARKARQEAGL